MHSTSPTPAQINATFVEKWAATYPTAYDISYYDPFIAAGRAGTPAALRKLTEWKNVGNNRPMPLSSNKEKAFQKLLAMLKSVSDPTESSLRHAFPETSPVFAIFWSHVLFDTPIFDVHTNRAFHWFHCGIYLPARGSSIPRGGHWHLYDVYREWFRQLLATAQSENPAINPRTLDRALFRWGLTNSATLSQPNLPTDQ
ncbi:MAG: hypothetical protein KF712_03155 [Akkermansiaceae bacterium]|nr:hypothetical protein [Akkermansiaceae bacterium]